MANVTIDIADIAELTTQVGINGTLSMGERDTFEVIVGIIYQTSGAIDGSL